MPIGIGGFFTDLGWKEILMIFGGEGLFSVFDGYTQRRWRGYGVKKGWKEPELYGQLCSSATLGLPILVAGAIRTTKYAYYESDTVDFFMNLLGGGLLYEGAGVIEALSELFAPWAK